MLFKIAVAGGVCAAVAGGASVAALAASNGPDRPAAPGKRTISTSASGHHRLPWHKLRTALRHVEHGEFVTGGRSGSEVTWDLIRGSVTAVSPTSISVAARDGFQLTFRVAGHTRVVLREHGRGSATRGSIAEVKRGDSVAVAGTDHTAGRIVDLG